MSEGPLIKILPYHATGFMNLILIVQVGDVKFLISRAYPLNSKCPKMRKKVS